MIKIALIIGIIGIALLLVISNIILPKEYKINEIYKLNLNDKIKLNAMIKNVKNYEGNFTLITLSDDTGDINGICNCGKIEKGNVEIIGRVDEYNKEKQINIDKIKKI